MELDHVATVSDGWAVDTCLARVEAADVAWCAPEVLRVGGDQARRLGTADGRVSADRSFARALEMARRQGALAWELRIALSIARLKRDQGRIEEARLLLRQTCQRFAEGFGTADLQSARELSARLDEPA